MRHVTHVYESRVSSEQLGSLISMCHTYQCVTHINVSHVSMCHTYQRVTHMKKVRQISRQGTSNKPTTRVKQANNSRHFTCDFPRQETHDEPENRPMQILGKETLKRDLENRPRKETCSKT